MRKLLTAIDGSEYTGRIVQELIGLYRDGLNMPAVPREFALFVDDQKAQRACREQGEHAQRSARAELDAAGHSLSGASARAGSGRCAR